MAAFLAVVVPLLSSLGSVLASVLRGIVEVVEWAIRSIPWTRAVPLWLACLAFLGGCELGHRHTLSVVNEAEPAKVEVEHHPLRPWLDHASRADGGEMVRTESKPTFEPVEQEHSNIDPTPDEEPQAFEPTPDPISTPKCKTCQPARSSVQRRGLFGRRWR